MDASSLAKLIAPILNDLLWTPPFRVNGCNDCGWFCREHAFITKMVFGQFGMQCDIVRGQVTIYVGGKQRFTTCGSGADHMWCVANEIVPCDLSMTFSHFLGHPNLDSPILGEKSNGLFSIIYGIPEDDLPPPVEDAICFTPELAVVASCHELIDCPTLLLPTAESGNISLAIAAFIDMLTAGRIGMPFADNTTQRQRLETLLETFPDPAMRLHQSIPAGF